MSVVGWAQMGVRNGGTGDLDLVALAGQTPYSGSNAVEYLITTPFGAFEEGTASVVGGRLSTRTVTSSSNSDAAITVPVPTRGVVVYLNAQIPAASTGGGGSFEDGDYGGIIVSGGGTVVSLVPEEVSEAIGAEEVTAAEVRTTLGVPASLGQRCQLGPLHFKGIADGDHELLTYADFPGTITKAITVGSEALTVNVKNGATSVTGLGAIAVTTSIANTNATAANTFAIGDRLIMTVSDTATTADVSITLTVDRNL